MRETEPTLDGAVKICYAAELLYTPGHSATSRQVWQQWTSLQLLVWCKLKGNTPRPAPAQWMQVSMFSCMCFGLRLKARLCPAYCKQWSRCQGKKHFAKQHISKRKEDERCGHWRWLWFKWVILCCIGIVNCDGEQEKDLTFVKRKQMNSVFTDKWCIDICVKLHED